jgi:hypothetical protein
MNQQGRTALQSLYNGMEILKHNQWPGRKYQLRLRVNKKQKALKQGMTSRRAGERKSYTNPHMSKLHSLFKFYLHSLFSYIFMSFLGNQEEE